MTIYIAGSISGRFPDHNFPAFNAAAKKLRALGFWVVNPAEGEVVGEQPWSASMRADLFEIITRCDAVHMIDGWRGCVGPTVELLVALAKGCKVVDDEGSEVAVPEASLSTGEVTELVRKYG